MPKNHTPVVAAIPNFNMANPLSSLLPQVLEQGYDAVYVLDDGSTDNSREIVESFDADVHFVPGQENAGPGANRNRIISALAGEAIIHFMDADVQLVSHDNPPTIRTAFKQPDLGALGGLIQLPSGEPWIFNYGPRYSLFSMAAGWSQAIVSELEEKHPRASRAIDAVTRWRHPAFPDTAKRPTTQQVFWIGEANFCISSEVFRRLGGFDPNLRYHEAQDLAIKLHQQGLEVRFDPEIAVEHPYVDMGDLVRQAQQGKAGRQLIRKYGLPLK